MESEIATETELAVGFRHIPVEIFYQRQPNGTHPTLPVSRQGHVTVAYAEVDGELQYGAAFCAPCDQFSRPLGRTIARGRLAKNPRPVERWSTETDPADEAVAAALEELPCRWLSASLR